MDFTNYFFKSQFYFVTSKFPIRSWKKFVFIRSEFFHLLSCSTLERYFSDLSFLSRSIHFSLIWKSHDNCNGALQTFANIYEISTFPVCEYFFDIRQACYFFFSNISGMFPFMTKLTLFLFVLQVRRSQCHSLLVDAGIGKSIFAMTRRS